MKKESRRSSRVSDLVRAEISRLVLIEAHDPELKRVTITDVEMPPDLKSARVFFSCLGGDEEREKALQALRRAGVARPRIAVSGLNPHAGEHGLFGDEEIRLIGPAARAAQAQGILASDPLPADTLFGKTAKGDYDAVVALYHDQGLIPLKMVAFGTCVNLTVGLPIIRTSVDHGTAFDIVGKGIADPGSLIEAVKLAASLARRRTSHAQA